MFETQAGADADKCLVVTSPSTSLLPSAKFAWKLGQLLGYFIKMFLHIFMNFTVGHFPIYFIPIYLTFSIFSSVFKTSQKHETQLHMGRDLLACGGWKLAGDSLSL